MDDIGCIVYIPLGFEACVCQMKIMSSINHFQNIRLHPIRALLGICCQEYVGIIWGKGFPHCGALRGVNKIYNFTLLYKSQ